MAAAAVVAIWAAPCRADIPPMCSDLDSLITCAQADAGKPCQGGGQCYAVSCGAGQSAVPPVTAIYKCAACPPVVPTTDGSCSSYSQLGMACGAGGTCAVQAAYCVTAAAPKLACVGPAPAQPTGPPTGEGAGGAGGGAAGGAGGVAAGGAAGIAAGGTGGVAAGGAGGRGGQSAGGTSGGQGSATTVSSGGGGCDVVPRVPSIGVIALALLLVGLVALVIDRRRRGR
jgi:hypothetical protein